MDDPRLRLARDDLADARLEGIVPAARYRATTALQLIVPSAAIRSAPDESAGQLDQLLFGEVFECLEEQAGFVFGQAAGDGYVGWVARSGLSAEVSVPSHFVSAPRAYAFAEPSIKSAARGPFGLGALVSVAEETGPLARAARLGWIATRHLTALGRTLGDPAAVAESLLGAPYLWGGRDSLGLDCSGLVQQAFMACGLALPRDTDQQQEAGAPIGPEALRRGDLVFWSGHVAMMVDGARIIHANAHHMAVAVEPLSEAIARIAAEPTAYRRYVWQAG
jgi:cell wall-associated NlpC family hydrolase